MTHSEILWDRFVLRTSAYAVQIGGGYSPARGNGGEDLPLTLDVLKAHCQGKHCVGLYQLDVDKVRWIAIDVDGLEGNSEGSQQAVKALVRQCRHFGLEPAVEWSGKKGWHLWIFTEAIPAVLARAIGQGIISETGEDGRDGCQEVVCFPKQISTETYGNLVKLPWGTRADNGNKGLFVDPDTLASAPVPSEQLRLLEAAPTYGQAFLQELVDENGWESLVSHVPAPQAGYASSLNGGRFPRLPCFQNLVDLSLDLTIPSGHRDNVLFALAGQERRREQDQWDVTNALLQINAERCKPPMQRREVEAKVASAFSMRAPVIGCEALQKASLCPVLTHGIVCSVFKAEREKRDKEAASLNKEPNRFSIAPLRKLETEPPIYTATVWGRDVVVDSEQLFNWRMFKKKVMETLDRLPTLPQIPAPDSTPAKEKYLPPDAVWTILVNEALEGLIREEAPPEDASAFGIAWGGVLEFISARTISESKDDLMKGHVYSDGYFVYFRGPKLLAHMKLTGTDALPTNRLWKMVQGRGGKNTVIRTSRQTVRVWAIPMECLDVQGGGDDGMDANAPLGLGASMEL